MFPFVAPLILNEVFIFRDHYDYFAPLRFHTAESLRQLELPLWNPYSGSGERWLANPQTGVFYLPAWLFVFLPFSRAYVLFLAFHALLLGFGSYLLCRLEASRQASIIAAAVLSASGPVLSLWDVTNNFSTFAWIPLLLWSGGSRETPARSPATASLIVAMMFLGGEPFLAAAGAALYAVVMAATGQAGWLKRLVLTATLAILLVSVQLLPFLELLRKSDRTDLSVVAGANLRESLAPREWLATLLPGTAIPGTDFTLAFSQTFIPVMYVGLLPMLFVAAALTGRANAAQGASALDRRKIWIPTAALAALLAGGHHVPGVAAISTALHLTVSRYPSRLAPVVLLALAVLIARGADQARLLPVRRRLATALAGLLVVVVAVTLLGSPRTAGSALRLIASTSIGVIVFWRFSSFRNSVIPTAGLALALSLDQLSAAMPLLRTAPHSQELPFRREMTRPGKLIRLPERTSGGAAVIPSIDRTAMISGYRNLYAYQADLSTAAPVTSAAYLRVHDEAIWRPRLDLLSYLGGRYLLSPRRIAASSFAPIGHVRTVVLYEHRSPFPPLSFWSADGAETIKGDALSHLLRRDFDATKTLLIQNGERAVPGRTVPVRGDVLRFETPRNAIVAVVHSSQKSIVATSQLSADGWSVRVDGKPARRLIANALFLATEIGPGNHRIEWRYSSPWLRAGIWMSLAGVAGVACMFVLSFSNTASRNSRLPRSSSAAPS